MTHVYPVFSSAGAARYSPRYRNHRGQVNHQMRQLTWLADGPLVYQAFLESITPSRGDVKMKRTNK